MLQPLKTPIDKKTLLQRGGPKERGGSWFSLSPLGRGQGEGCPGLSHPSL